MPSLSLQNWLAVRATALDEIESAHRGVGGSGPGRRYATQHINQAYAMMVSAQFQAYCRDLHLECLELLASSVTPISLQLAFREEFLLHRKLDRANPNPGNIGADFNRFGLPFWVEVENHDARNAARKQSLEELNRWRNAIAHQDFDPAVLGGTIALQLQQVRAWRNACNSLAGSFDEVMRQYLTRTLGAAPW